MNYGQHFNTFDIIFENCEVVRVDARAIKRLNFEVDTVSYTYHQLQMMYVKRLKSFHLSLDISNTDWFTRPASQKDFDRDQSPRST